MSNENENENATITLGELTGALKRLGYHSDAHAPTIFDSVMEHREPTWRGGDVVADSHGNFWMRTYSGQWFRFGTEMVFPNDKPVRPLRKVN